MLYLVGVVVAMWVASAIWRSHMAKEQEIQANGRSERRPSALDSFEQEYWSIDEPCAVTARLRFEYTDAEGRLSEREVDVREFGRGPNGKTYILGHCALRKDVRTFRTDRMEDTVDLDTGEVIIDVKRYLKTRYQASPAAGADVLLAEEFDALRVLLYIGKADGRLTAAEKAIIRDAARALRPSSKLTDEAIDMALRNLDVPTLAAFKVAVGRVSKAGERQKSAMVDAAKKMIATQKTVHPAEADALAYMERRFARSASENVAPESVSPSDLSPDQDAPG